MTRETARRIYNAYRQHADDSDISAERAMQMACDDINMADGRDWCDHGHVATAIRMMGTR